MRSIQNIIRASCLIALTMFVIIIGGNNPLLAQTAVSINACNAVDQQQVPGSSTTFIGRHLINTTSDPCSGFNWKLSIYQMNWTANTLTYQSDIISLPVTVGSDTIVTAYDPTLVQYNGELWVAFECAGTGPNLGGNPAGSCIAPLNATTYAIDTSRITIAVKGSIPVGSGSGYSASVPKIFVYGSTPYLYWSALRIVIGPQGYLPVDATTRGAALTQESGGLQRLWVSGSGSAPTSSNASTSVQVMGLGTGSISDGLADSFGVEVVGSNILLTTGVGGKGCTNPGSLVYGCYRLQIRSTTTPLGANTFNSSLVTSPTFPFNNGEYTKFITDPSGNKHLMGAYFTPTLNGSPAPSNTISGGFVRYATTPSSYTYGSTDSPPLPNPTYSANYLSSTFDVIQQFYLTCNAANPLPNTSDGSCYSGAARLCQSQGYQNGGFLEDWSGTNTNNVTCVKSGYSTLLNINISALTAYQAGCTITTMISDSCASAIKYYCVDAGYGGGGFGPLEYVNPSVQITCLGTQLGFRLVTNFTALNAQDSTCTSTSTQPSACNRAATRVCRANGYLGSFGITDHYLNDAAIGCFIPNVTFSALFDKNSQYAMNGPDLASPATVRRHDEGLPPSHQ